MNRKITPQDIMEASVASFIILFFAAIAVCVLGVIGYTLVTKYNNRQECVKLGVPLYRCTDKTYKADIEIKR